MKSAHQPFCQPPPHAGRTHPGFPWHSSRCQAALSGSHHAPSGDGQAAWAVVVHRGGFRAGRNHLNCGIVGTFMRGGGIGATFLAFPIPLGSTNILFNAPNAAAFGRPPPKCPVAAEPAPCANEAAGEAKTTKNAKATFTELLNTRRAPLMIH